MVAPGGIQFPVAGLFAAGKKGKELQEHMGQGYEASRRSGWDPSERISDQDVDGVTAEVLYTSIGLPLFGLRDRELQSACFRVFNDWLAEYCSANPRRLIGIGLISLADIPLAINELERCVTIGLRGAMIANAPVEPYHSSIYYPFWDATSRLGVPLSLHIITTSKALSIDQFGTETFTIKLDWMHETQCSLALMILGGVFERFPKLRIVSTENDIGWIPYFLHHLDHSHEKGLAANLPLKPSEYARRQLFATFQDDPCGVALYDMFGEDNFMWASDFPHSDSTWPHSHDVISRNFLSVPAGAKQKIVCGNAARLYDIHVT
jgi:uncharacterized protein